MKVIYRIIALTGVMLLVSACMNEGAEHKERKAVESQHRHYTVSQPVPRFDFSLERDLLRQLYQARNEQVATYSVWTDFGKIIDHCPSIGYGLPYDTSLTNPLKRDSGHRGAIALEQQEPNGIYPSKNTAATWVFCVVDTDEGVKTVPVYVEQKVLVYPYPVKVENGRIVRAGIVKPSVTIKDQK